MSNGKPVQRLIHTCGKARPCIRQQLIVLKTLMQRGKMKHSIALQPSNYHSSMKVSVSVFVIISQFLWVRNPGATYLGPLDLSQPAVISRPRQRKTTSWFTHMGGSRIQFLKGCWAEGLSSAGNVDWSPPSVICYVGLSTGQLTVRQLASLE